jgi:hypothetical protein
MTNSIYDDPDHWRALAKTARDKAELLTHRDARRTLISIAEDYEHLAERAEQKAKKKAQKSDS